MKVDIIIPFYNESEGLPNTVNELQTFINQNDLNEAQVIFVDDGSTDRSTEVLTECLMVSGSNAKIIRLSRNFGSHAAVRAGLLNSKGDFAIFLPADLQDPLDLVIKLGQQVKEGYDVIFASRDNTAAGFFSWIFTRTYSWLMKKFVNSNYPQNGFDVVFMNRKVIESINSNIEGNSSLMLQILNMGFSQKFVSYAKLKRKLGRSKWTLSKKIKLFIDSFAAFSYAPVRFVTLIGFSFAALGFLWTVYIILRELIIGDLSSGWPALISILMIGFGLTNISLGIIAEYLWRTLDASRDRPVFIIDDVIELPGNND